jgi:hypothetical protein
MAAKWVEAIKLKRKLNPLYYDNAGGARADMTLPAAYHSVNACTCKMCGGKGKQVPLYAMTNYGNAYNHCYKCGCKYT